MHKHNLNNDKMRPPNHVNAFIDLNGVPYLLGVYLDRNQLRQIDRSMIRSDIFINTTERMRAVVNININDVGFRSNGLPKIMGNASKQRHLLRMMQRHARRMEHRLDVFKDGIIVRINYQLENQRTGQVIRSAQEDLRIKTRNFFTDINPRNINDNGIIVNFYNALISTINQFTHGTDRMLVRITQIQLFYEVLRRENPAFAGRQSPSRNNDRIIGMEDIPDFSFSGFHGKHQSRQFIGHPGTCRCDDFIENAQHPPSWFLFNRFYRFDNMGKDIILHIGEIKDRNNRITLVPCGRVIVNRTFVINPGHRIIWRMNIWKNDLTVFNNTQPVAKALGVQNIGHPCDTRHPTMNRADYFIQILNNLKELGQTKKQVFQWLKDNFKFLEDDPYHDHTPVENCDTCGEDIINCICGMGGIEDDDPGPVYVGANEAYSDEAWIHAEEIIEDEKEDDLNIDELDWSDVDLEEYEVNDELCPSCLKCLVDGECDCMGLCPICSSPELCDCINQYCFMCLKLIHDCECDGE